MHHVEVGFIFSVVDMAVVAERLNWAKKNSSKFPNSIYCCIFDSD
jgi:hypothetical protein